MFKEFVKCWEKWEISLFKEVEVFRVLVYVREFIEVIVLYVFGDVSG